MRVAFTHTLASTVTMAIDMRIQDFFAHSPHAVVGATRNRSKYGNRVLRAYLENALPVYPIHPSDSEIEGLTAYPDLHSLPTPVHGISIVTPPAVTETIVEQAAESGIRHLWIQPGAESPRAIERAKSHGMNVIGGTSCILLAFTEPVD